MTLDMSKFDPKLCPYCGELKHPYTETETQRHGLIFSKQAKTPVGVYHLHFIFMRGKWQWGVRSGERKTILCDTSRCRVVKIQMHVAVTPD